MRRHPPNDRRSAASRARSLSLKNQYQENFVFFLDDKGAAFGLPVPVTSIGSNVLITV
jgi:hypothetical protein